MSRDVLEVAYQRDGFCMHFHGGKNVNVEQCIVANWSSEETPDI